VLTFLRIESAVAAKCIAKNFEVFLRAAGTVALVVSIPDEEEFAKEVANFAGADDESKFWIDRVRGLQ
jgi:hypothetical protein